MEENVKESRRANISHIERINDFGVERQREEREKKTILIRNFWAIKLDGRNVYVGPFLIWLTKNYRYFRAACFQVLLLALGFKFTTILSSSSVTRASQATRKTSSTVAHRIIVLVKTCLKTIRRMKTLFPTSVSSSLLFSHTHTPPSSFFFIYEGTTIYMKKKKEPMEENIVFLHFYISFSWVGSM